jgi:digeranylgeranylglycerophospholipid reductase
VNKSRYDLIVVGAGPAGSVCAWTAAKAGISVLLLEKDREIGMPVRCGEGSSFEGLKDFLPIDNRWISQRINRLLMVSPDGTKVPIDTDELGCVLDRRLFDSELACRAGEAGAEVRARAYVHGLIMSNGTVSGIRVNLQGVEHTIEARLVVGADGVESRIGRMAGIRTFVHPADMDTCYQTTLANIDIDANSCEMHFGNKLAPGGYGWIFPKGARIANVGLGISGDNGISDSARAYLQRFIDSRFEHYTVINEVAGGVPCLPTLKQITSPGLMLVGDAARQVNPLTGGGILSGMTAGRIAGEVAAKAVRNGNVSVDELAEYPKRWDHDMGKSHERLYRLKKAVFKLSDQSLNRTAHSMMKLPSASRDMVSLFKTALVKNPKLWIDIVKAFT